MDPPGFKFWRSDLPGFKNFKILNYEKFRQKIGAKMFWGKFFRGSLPQQLFTYPQRLERKKVGVKDFSKKFALTYQTFLKDIPVRLATL